MDKFYLEDDTEAEGGEGGDRRQEQNQNQDQQQQKDQEEEEEEVTDETTGLLEGYRRPHSNSSHRTLPVSASFPRFSSEHTPLLRASPSFVGLYGSSWTSRSGPSPYTADNKPKRRPFHHAVATSESVRSPPPDTTTGASHLYNRYRYYNRLRADAPPGERALIIPDHIVPRELFLPYFPGHVPDADGKQASHITIIAIWNTMMGTSLMTMPWAFGQAGFLGGIIIMLAMAAIALYTATRLLTLQKTMGLQGPSQELSQVCQQLLGGPLGRVTEGLSVTFSVLTLVGAQVVYWVLMSNFLYNTGEVIYDAVNGEIHDNSSGLLCPPNVTSSDQSATVGRHDGSGFHRWWQQDLTVPLYLVVPFVFLLNLRDARIFTYFNSLGAISVLVMYLFVVSKAAIWGFNINFTEPSNPLYVPLFKGSFMCLTGTLSLAYFIHNCVVTIMQGNRHQENNVRDLTISYCMVAATYIPIGVLFYSTFPLPKSCVVDNFLDNFPPHDIILAVVRGFLFFQILTVYPLLGFFIRNQLFTYFLGTAHEFRLWRVGLLNTVLITFSVLVAIFYPNIGFIIRWVGSIAGLAYIFILPCFTYMVALYSKNRLSAPQIVLHSAIVIVGIANFVSQFFTE